ncbi:HGxxPAAW family protein [Streptomyces sp. NPDC050619]|uniref:HGxxPAAW family protein n=1 Tax=Streptomyces sp. NPDC050619 TaxID=3157214 RepID=UPI00344AFB82
MSAHQYDEGHTVAGWTGFGIATVGTAVLGLGVCMVSVPILAAGLGIAVVSVLVTWALHLTGWGKPPGRRPREQWGMRVKDPGARAGHPGCVGCRLAGRGGRRTAAVGEVAVPAGGESTPTATTTATTDATATASATADAGS